MKIKTKRQRISERFFRRSENLATFAVMVKLKKQSTMKNYVIITDKNDAILIDETKLNHYNVAFKTELTDLEKRFIDLILKTDNLKFQLFAYYIQKDGVKTQDWQITLSTSSNMNAKVNHFEEVDIDFYFTQVEINNN